MMAKRRVKTKAAAFPVPQSRDEAVEAIARIGVLQRERERIQTRMNDELAVLKEKFEEEARPHADEIHRLTEGVRLWCEVHRQELTHGGKVKHANMSSGEVKWRMRPAKVTLRNIEGVIERLKEFGLKRFLRVKEEVNKDAILAEQEAVKHVQGITITKGEDFVIVPFETELEEVA